MQTIFAIYALSILNIGIFPSFPEGRVHNTTPLRPVKEGFFDMAYVVS